MIKVVLVDDHLVVVVVLLFGRYHRDDVGDLFGHLRPSQLVHRWLLFLK